jgi:hypothetical protein
MRALQESVSRIEFNVRRRPGGFSILGMCWMGCNGVELHGESEKFCMV